jgi:hypothetical protein
VKELPLAPANCGLDAAALRAQDERYAQLGKHLATASRGPQELVAQFDADVDRALLAETVKVERGCCSFLTIELEDRRLRIAADDPAQAAAIAAIARFLGV